MQSRWETWLSSAEREKETIKAEVARRGGRRDQADRLGSEYASTAGSSRESYDTLDARPAGDQSLETRRL
jgi:hypothetical protein